MKKKYERSARVKRSHLQALRREFGTLEMKVGEGVSEYFSRVLTVANKMTTYGERMTDVTVVEKILKSLKCGDEGDTGTFVNEEDIPKELENRAYINEDLIASLKPGENRGESLNFHENILSSPQPSKNSRASPDPVQFEDAVKYTHWRTTIDIEIKATKTNNTWELTDLLVGAKKIEVKWVYKTKLKEDEEINKFKARLVAKGESNILIASLYVDDLIFTGNNELIFAKFKTSILREFDMTDPERILRYLRGTTKLGIFYKKGGREGLIGYTNSDYAGDLEDRKSTSRYALMIGSRVVAWSSRKQPIVTFSTTEAEFVVTAACASQVIWMQQILEKLSLKESKGTTIFCDNSSTIKLSKNSVLHGHSKHIDVRFHFLRDLTQGAVKLVY
ncbi:PREDICTED: uncharacterized protein LOC105111066 [Populus euphratica]|uniref:Uncharacterized protein LOC105111066 n=1 Tax=Populus euphratica TaxID=75702 RepID=A0AAJ6T602_POPEU|nr:PREDICTED: uncharacterized protein LOC105111066 [Populus euphratica]